MPTTKAELLQGTLDLLILKTLAPEPLHGYAIAQRIQQRTDDVLVVEEGSLYPALYRMEEKGWIGSVPRHRWPDVSLASFSLFSPHLASNLI